ncbi:hypothetical protein CCR75_004782 [Bremia lactucae]|uniref:Uncharacterized protein n=1 Tax=Bremia lactucae TaxID=4779 RepID=A0A976FNC6_BRELC|nr:hypothetical protein CCR75_004782 [Bremia lactucae]
MHCSTKNNHSTAQDSRSTFFYITIANQTLPFLTGQIPKIIVAGLDNKGINRFYGLAKTSKLELCIRPIVSNRTSVMQDISKWLHFMMQPHLQRTPTYRRDSDQLLQGLFKPQMT